jgi:hypothetical protein
MPGCGGFRKLRWAAQGRGKSGGVRVIHYCVYDDYIIIAKAYAKNEKESLAASEKEDLRLAAKYLNEIYPKI